MYKLICFVPISHIDEVKNALFGQGAGRLGNYDHCSWQVLGEGQFRPLVGANPALGDVGDVHAEPEYRLEMLCDPVCIERALAALKQAHPYEEPAFEVIQLENPY